MYIRYFHSKLFRTHHTINFGYWAYFAIRYTLFIKRILPSCTQHHLWSTCAVNRVHDGGERSSENQVSRTHSTLKHHPEVNRKRNTPVLFTSGSHKACKPHLLQITCHMTRKALHISLNTHWLRIMVSFRRMESPYFTSILARWMRLMIYCTTMYSIFIRCHHAAWGCGFHCILYLVHVLYWAHIYTYHLSACGY